ncbi:leucine-rich repeat protein, partial [Bacteroides cellulosilyticus]
YQDFVDKLRGAFNKLELIMKGEPAVYLADPVWREIAISLWDTDHDGFITAAEASENRLVSFENFDNAAKIEILDLSALYTNITPYIVNLTRIKKVIYGNSKYASSVSANSAKGNTSIEYVDAGDYYTSIDYGAFWKCTSLKIVILNKNITVIDQRAFQDCTSMESCYIKATIPPALGTWAFDNNPCKIYVPHESVATYKAATNWNLYASQIYGYDF